MDLFFVSKRCIEKESKKEPHITQNCSIRTVISTESHMIFGYLWCILSHGTHTRSSLTSADARYAEWSIHYNKQYNNSVEHWLPVCVDVTTNVSDIRQNNVNLFFTVCLKSGQSANAK